MYQGRIGFYSLIIQCIRPSDLSKNSRLAPIERSAMQRSDTSTVVTVNLDRGSERCSATVTGSGTARTMDVDPVRASPSKDTGVIICNWLARNTVSCVIR
jgi:hypothetical protein